MVKKIKKYLKFVVCCALILSLIAPSYAALSASDGSAFVTKAEFDAALADFNARLTTFEAGINSKIDSQVSSYLDRNGIWNGKEFEWECVENPKWHGQLFPDVRYAHRAYNMDQTNVQMGINWFTLCSSVPKTGLLVSEFYFIISGASYELSPFCSGAIRCTAEFGLTQVNNYTQSFYTSTISFPNIWAGEIAKGRTDKNVYYELNTVRSFVEKGKPIYFYYRNIDRAGQITFPGCSGYNTYDKLPLFVNTTHVETEYALNADYTLKEHACNGVVRGKEAKFSSFGGDVKNQWPDTAVPGIGWIFKGDPRSGMNANQEWQNASISTLHTAIKTKPSIY